MGPLASTEFLRRVYTARSYAIEQQMPRVILDSDPTLPDRSETIAFGREKEFSDILERRLQHLVDAGATTLVVACLTAHHFLDGVSAPLLNRLISLVSVALRLAEQRPGRHLLLATNGARRAAVFERHPAWPWVADRIELPGTADQERIHSLIYRLKRRAVASGEALAIVESLRGECDGFLLGCTDFHPLATELKTRFGELAVIDTLCELAAFSPETLNDDSLRHPTVSLW
jgi:aspartate racemase